METLLLILHYLLCFFMIVVILLQAGKGADIGAVFGGASQTVFGGRGPATFLSKLTAVVAILFLVTSISLAHLAKTGALAPASVIDKAPLSGETKAPEAASPEAPAGAPEGTTAPTPTN